MASNEGSSSSKGSDKKKSSSNPVAVAQVNQPIPFGSMPKLPAEDDKVDWVMTGIEVNAYLSRHPVSYVRALEELQSDDPVDRAAQVEALGQAHRTVYSLVVEMCGLNKTAMLQVRAHAISDPTKNPNNLWRMIEKRFTEEKFNKVQDYLNEIEAFKIESNEDNKVFIDHFRKLVDDVRSIDESEVPTDLNLMAVLKKAMMELDGMLWGNLQFNSEGMSLNRMMDIISKWKK